MSFNPIAAKTIASLRHCLPPSPTVVELGNQRLTVNTSTLEKIIQHYAEKPAPNVNLKELERQKTESQESIPRNRVVLQSARLPVLHGNRHQFQCQPLGIRSRGGFEEA
jgi:hypothetical protein